MSNFDDLPLHDAVMSQVIVDWKAREVCIHVKPNQIVGLVAGDWVVKFSLFSQVNVPRMEPWGESLFVNTLKADGSRYEIEMQSGDTIVVLAEKFSFDALAS